MVTELRRAINQAKKDFPGCKICGPVKFSTFDRYYIRDSEGHELRRFEELR
jgi:hypothetical protein